MNVCDVGGCGRNVFRRVWCVMHYSRWQRHGDPLAERIFAAPRIVDGYYLEYGNRKPQFVHWTIAEKALGKPLPSGVIVHHANGNSLDNRPENLVICPSRAYHALLHQRMRARDACGNPDWRKCWLCKKYDDPANLAIFDGEARHSLCFKTYRAKAAPIKIKAGAA